MLVRKLGVCRTSPGRLPGAVKGSQSESGGAASSPLMFNSAGLQVQCKTELHLAPSSSKMGSSSEACQPLVAQAQGAEMPALPSACQAGSTAGQQNTSSHISGQPNGRADPASASLQHLSEHAPKKPAAAPGPCLNSSEERQQEGPGRACLQLGSSEGLNSQTLTTLSPAAAGGLSRVYASDLPPEGINRGDSSVRAHGHSGTSSPFEGSTCTTYGTEVVAGQQAQQPQQQLPGDRPGLVLAQQPGAGNGSPRPLADAATASGQAKCVTDDEELQAAASRPSPLPVVGVPQRTFLTRQAGELEQQQQQVLQQQTLLLQIPVPDALGLVTRLLGPALQQQLWAELFQLQQHHWQQQCWQLQQLLQQQRATVGGGHSAAGTAGAEAEAAPASAHASLQGPAASLPHDGTPPPLELDGPVLVPGKILWPKGRACEAGDVIPRNSLFLAKVTRINYLQGAVQVRALPVVLHANAKIDHNTKAVLLSRMDVEMWARAAPEHALSRGWWAMQLGRWLVKGEAVKVDRPMTVHFSLHD